MISPGLGYSDLSVEPEKVNFKASCGNCDVSEPFSLTIRNRGNTTEYLEDLTLNATSGLSAYEWRLTNIPSSISPGSYRTITVDVSPKGDPVPSSGSLRLLVRGLYGMVMFDYVHVNIDIPWRFEWSPSEISFEEDVCDDRTAEVTLRETCGCLDSIIGDVDLSPVGGAPDVLDAIHLEPLSKQLSAGGALSFRLTADRDSRTLNYVGDEGGDATIRGEATVPLSSINKEGTSPTLPISVRFEIPDTSCHVESKDIVSICGETLEVPLTIKESGRQCIRGGTLIVPDALSGFVSVRPDVVNIKQGGSEEYKIRIRPTSSLAPDIHIDNIRLRAYSGQSGFFNCPVRVEIPQGMVSMSLNKPHLDPLKCGGDEILSLTIHESNGGCVEGVLEATCSPEGFSSHVTLGAQTIKLAGHEDLAIPIGVHIPDNIDIGEYSCQVRLATSSSDHVVSFGFNITEPRIVVEPAAFVMDEPVCDGPSYSMNLTVTVNNASCPVKFTLKDHCSTPNASISYRTPSDGASFAIASGVSEQVFFSLNGTGYIRPGKHSCTAKVEPHITSQVFVPVRFTIEPPDIDLRPIGALPSIVCGGDSDQALIGLVHSSGTCPNPVRLNGSCSRDDVRLRFGDGTSRTKAVTVPDGAVSVPFKVRANESLAPGNITCTIEARPLDHPMVSMIFDLEVVLGLILPYPARIDLGSLRYNDSRSEKIELKKVQGTCPIRINKMPIRCSDNAMGRVESSGELVFSDRTTITVKLESPASHGLMPGSYQCSVDVSYDHMDAGLSIPITFTVPEPGLLPALEKRSFSFTKGTGASMNDSTALMLTNPSEHTPLLGPAYTIRIIDCPLREKTLCQEFEKRVSFSRGPLSKVGTESNQMVPMRVSFSFLDPAGDYLWELIASAENLATERHVRMNASISTLRCNIATERALATCTGGACSAVEALYGECLALEKSPETVDDATDVAEAILAIPAFDLDLHALEEVAFKAELAGDEIAIRLNALERSVLDVCTGLEQTRAHCSIVMAQRNATFWRISRGLCKAERPQELAELTPYVRIADLIGSRTGAPECLRLAALVKAEDAIGEGKGLELQASRHGASPRALVLLSKAFDSYRRALVSYGPIGLHDGFKESRQVRALMEQVRDEWMNIFLTILLTLVLCSLPFLAIIWRVFIGRERTDWGAFK